MENEETNHQKRLMDELDSRFNEIRDESREDPLEPLSVTETVEVEIELSTGGPSDGFRIYLEKDTREPVNGCYYFSDWGWSKEHWLTKDEVMLISNYFWIC